MVETSRNLVRASHDDTALMATAASSLEAIEQSNRLLKAVDSGRNRAGQQIDLEQMAADLRTLMASFL